MPHKSLIKKPKQSRALATVDAIVEATAQLLQQQNCQEITTNRIAELAGVSIGSVYQYFGNKNDIYQAVLDHYFARLVADIKNQDISAQTGIENIIEQLIYTAYSAGPEGPELLRKIRQVPDTKFQEKLAQTKTQIVEFMRAILMAQPEAIKVKDLDFSLQLSIDAVEGIFVNVPEGQRADVLAKEMACLICCYLFTFDTAEAP